MLSIPLTKKGGGGGGRRGGRGAAVGAQFNAKAPVALFLNIEKRKKEGGRGSNAQPWALALVTIAGFPIEEGEKGGGERK